MTALADALVAAQRRALAALQKAYVAVVADLFQAVKLDPEGMERAREVAQWFIGDASWADMIVEAYFLPTLDYQEAHEGING